MERLTDEEYKYIYSRVPRSCVDLVIQKDARILLIKRDQPPCLGQWALPGGGIHQMESIEDAIFRIAEAETGLTVVVNRLIGVDEYLMSDDWRHSIGISYLVEPRGGTLKENARFFRYTPEDIFPTHGRILAEHDLLNGR